MGKPTAAPLKFDTKSPSDAAFSAAFSNFDYCWPEVADDVILGMAVEYVAVDISVKFDDSTLNIGRVIRLFDRPDLFYARLCSI